MDASCLFTWFISNYVNVVADDFTGDLQSAIFCWSVQLYLAWRPQEGDTALFTAVHVLSRRPLLHTGLTGLQTGLSIKAAFSLYFIFPYSKVSLQSSKKFFFLE